MTNWTSADIPSQLGRTAVITGTGGLGFEDALALSRAGADVIIAGRNPTKGSEAVERIRQRVPGARVRFEAMDLADLGSVADFASRLSDQLSSLDILINNAGVMTPPKREITDDGFELQFGTNYLSHFALTGHLLPLLMKSDDARIITLSSVAARNGAINFDDLQAERDYQPMPVYAQSKLACLMFAHELQRRSDAADWGLSSFSAHPGISRTELLPNGTGPRSRSALARRYLWFVFQPAAQGALPTLFAATSPQATGGSYYGPNGFHETRGFPALATIPKQALDLQTAARLWAVSEALTGVRFEALSPLLVA